MDGVAQCDGAVVKRPPSSSWHGNGADRELVAARDRQLLEAMKAHPGASASHLAELLKIGKGAVVGRWGRLGRLGVLEKRRDGGW
jgi:DNA-binding transcriptional ArsR family regulator